MNLVKVRLIDRPASMQHNVKGCVTLHGDHSPKEYTFLNIVGAKPADYVTVSVNNNITYGLVTAIIRDAWPKDVVSNFLKPVLSVISNKKVAEYYRIRHHYRSALIKHGKWSSSAGYDPTLYRDALREVTDPLSPSSNQSEELTKQEIHQLYVEAAARKVAEERARLEEQEQLAKLETLLTEVKKSIKLLRSKGITFKTI